MTTKKTEDASASQTTETTAKTDAKPYFATRRFKDAGTERTFQAGDELKDVEPGSIANYARAGLASTEKPSAPEQAA